jgi:fucose permease
MMAGLAVYGCGTLVFWPSAVLTSYGAFVASNFIVAYGLSCLEIAANPFIALCGPLEYAEVRLNMSQGFQGIGTVVSPLLAMKVLFGKITRASSLVDVQWAYLGIAIFVWLLAVVFYYIPLPEASDEELEELADRRSAVYRARIGPYRVVFVTLALGVFSQFCYVGLQESFGGNVQSLISLVRPNSKLSPFDYLTVGHTVFAVGRFVAAFLNYVFKPRWILLFLYTGIIICCGLLTGLGAEASAAILMTNYFFEAGTFAIIYAISMRGLGEHTKTGSAFMATAISGGSPFPVIQWGVANHRGLKYSFIVPMATACFGMVFALYLNLVPQARAQVDPVHEDRTARRNRRAIKRQNSAASAASVDSSAQKFGLAGILARRKKDVPTAEHVEKRSPPPTEKEEIVQMSAPQGVIGSLTPWPTEDGGSSSSNHSPGPDITRHRPVWEDQDESEEDDYHAVMRRTTKK